MLVGYCKGTEKKQNMFRNAALIKKDICLLLFSSLHYVIHVSDSFIFLSV